MEHRYRLCLAVLLLAVGCGLMQSTNFQDEGLLRVFKGHGSSGDSFSIVINPVTQTLSYKNISNGETRTIPYFLQASRRYNLRDPKGNLLWASEGPDHVLVLETANAGPRHSTRPLVIAYEQPASSLLVASAAGTSTYLSALR